MRSLRTIIALLLALSLLCGLCTGAVAEDNIASGCKPIFHVIRSVESAQLPLYIHDKENRSEATVYYINGEAGIPYLSLVDCKDIYNAIMTAFEIDSSLDFGWEGNAAVLTCANGSKAFLDAVDNTITFPDRSLFSTCTGNVQRLDLVGTYKKDGKTYLIDHKPVAERVGQPIIYDLEGYGLQLLQWNGVMYIPLQTFSDVFLSAQCVGLMYNGKLLYGGTPTDVTPTGKHPELYTLFQDAAETELTQALKQFNYNELCFVLDTNYGLMEEHNIDNFADLFVQTGLIEYFFSDDPGGSYAALSKLAMVYLSDLHSMAVGVSPYAGANAMTTSLQMMTNMMSIEEFMNAQFKYSSLRSKYYPDGPVGYEEVGNTAYITFDNFTFDAEKDYYHTEIANDPSDTIVLLLYANEQLHRKDCPIENVVIDLSNNGGGVLDAAVCVVAWFLGRCDIYIRQMRDRCQSCTEYLFDANLDGLFNESFDNVNNYKLYCIISPNSFSCGNLVPAAFASSDEVFLIGRRSGGGACSVLYLSDAMGDVFTLSSPYRINTAVNGSYISVDQGVAPDLVINDPAKLYDRAYMTDLINALP